MAEVPAAFIVPWVTGSVGEKEKVVAVRFVPVIVSVNGVPARTAFGASVRMAGTGRIDSGDGEVTVTPLTVTDMVPFVALAGIITTSDVEVADMTVSATPFNMTISADGVVLKPWPWMVMVDPAGTVPGVTLKMVRAPGVMVERRICWMLPTGS